MHTTQAEKGDRSTIIFLRVDDIFILFKDLEESLDKSLFRL